MIAGLRVLVPAVPRRALAGIGIARLLFAAAAESMTQLSTNLGIRGRVMSFYLMVVIGGQAAGGRDHRLHRPASTDRRGRVLRRPVAVPALIAGIAVGIVVARRAPAAAAASTCAARAATFVRIVPSARSLAG